MVCMTSSLVWIDLRTLKQLQCRGQKPEQK